MYFTTRNRPSTKIFNYTISIEEVFSKTCKIFLEIKKCYSSCRNCTKSIDNSNEENHNCMFCSDNFYHFQNETNCYSLSDVEVIHPDWYLDEEKNIFDLCDPTCKTCVGPTDANCSSCPLDSNGNQLYLYYGKCITQCPDGTFANISTYTCNNCYKNCKTCYGEKINIKTAKSNKSNNNNFTPKEVLKNIYNINPYTTQLKTRNSF